MQWHTLLKFSKPMNQKHNGLIAAFVKKKDIIGFLTMLYDNYAISPAKVFIYDIKGNDDEYLATFKVLNKARALSEIHHSTIVHVKNGCIFSINALNKLIESNKGNEDIDNQSYQVKWEDYNGMLMMIKYGNLAISPIQKIETKDIIFKK